MSRKRASPTVLLQNDPLPGGSGDVCAVAPAAKRVKRRRRTNKRDEKGKRKTPSTRKTRRKKGSANPTARIKISEMTTKERRVLFKTVGGAMGLKPDYVSKLLETKPKKLGDEEQTIRRRLKNRLVTAIQKRRRGAAVSAFAEQVAAAEARTKALMARVAAAEKRHLDLVTVVEDLRRIARVPGGVSMRQRQIVPTPASHHAVTAASVSPATAATSVSSSPAPTGGVVRSSPPPSPIPRILPGANGDLRVVLPVMSTGVVSTAPPLAPVSSVSAASSPSVVAFVSDASSVTDSTSWDDGDEYSTASVSEATAAAALATSNGAGVAADTGGIASSGPLAPGAVPTAAATAASSAVYPLDAYPVAGAGVGHAFGLFPNFGGDGGEAAAANNARYVSYLAAYPPQGGVVGAPAPVYDMFAAAGGVNDYVAALGYYPSQLANLGSTAVVNGAPAPTPYYAATAAQNYFYFAPPAPVPMEMVYAGCAACEAGATHTHAAPSV